MPLIEVSYDTTIPDDTLRLVGQLLPDIVSEAVDCPEEPWVGPPSVGDIEIRFRPMHALDVGELCVIEVRTKLFPSRQKNKQERADLIRDRLLAAIDIDEIGVWLVLLEASWSQGE